MKVKNLKLNSEDQVIVKITGEVLRAFHIEEANDYDPIDYDDFEIFNAIKDDIVKTKLTVRNHDGEKIFTTQNIINHEERRGAEIHRLIKKNLYQILTNDLKLEGVPYGIMHGVRPTKIVHRWIRNGFGITKHGVIDRDKIARRLRTDYLTNYDKAQLLTEVSIRQIPILGSSDDKTIGVYVGIPFCVTRCLYCSFPANLLPSDEKVAQFMSALTKDIKAAAEEIERYDFKVQSIYIGGGTPTALPEDFFVEMMNKVTDAFYTPHVEEFTVECGRPDTITSKKIAVLKDCHVTRVSVNPQTMQQKTLDRIGRQHSVQQVILAFKKLRTLSDFQINMDLILGLPGENLADVKDSLEKVLELDPDNITLHALAIKRGSQLQTQLADEVSTIKDFELPEDKEVRKMAEVAEKMLRDKKYLPYYLYRQGYISGQIENIGYCKHGAEGIYNIQIMDERQTILGVGAAATTKVPDNENLRLQTSFNAKDLSTYLRNVDKYIEKRSKTLDEIYNSTPEASDNDVFDQFLEEIIESAKEKAEPVIEFVEYDEATDESSEETQPEEKFQYAEETQPEEKFQYAEEIQPEEKFQYAEETQTEEKFQYAEETQTEELKPVETFDDSDDSTESKRFRPRHRRNKKFWRN